MDRAVFLNQDNWLGSYYELCLELGPTGEDERLLSALRTLWAQPRLNGAWTTRDQFGGPALPLKLDDGFVAPRYGIIQIREGYELGCVSHTVRETDGSDWLDLCIPTGMLGLTFSIAYPLTYADNPWLHAIDRILVEVGASLFRSDPFQLGIVGEEVSGVTDANSIAADDCRNGVFLLREENWKLLKIDRGFSICAPGLVAVGMSGKM